MWGLTGFGGRYGPTSACDVLVKTELRVGRGVRIDLGVFAEVCCNGVLVGVVAADVVVGLISMRWSVNPRCHTGSLEARR
jgi:hypothetical protein